LSRKAVHNWVTNGFTDDEEVKTEVRKLLRQQPKYFYAAGFDAMVKRLGKCINVDGEYVKKKIVLFPALNITYFTFYFGC
jgi:hypothetical protein